MSAQCFVFDEDRDLFLPSYFHAVVDNIEKFRSWNDEPCSFFMTFERAEYRELGNHAVAAIGHFHPRWSQQSASRHA